MKFLQNMSHMEGDYYNNLAKKLFKLSETKTEYSRWQN
jgi:hypothetical protein